MDRFADRARLAGRRLLVDRCSSPIHLAAAADINGHDDIGGAHHLRRCADHHHLDHYDDVDHHDNNAWPAYRDPTRTVRDGGRRGDQRHQQSR